MSVRAQSGHRVVILGAGRSLRSSSPPAMVDIDHHGRVLDWLLHAFGALPAPEIYFVGGYMADAVMRAYPDLHFVINPQWERTGPATSLSLAPIQAKTATYVSYSDVVFRPLCVSRMESTDADVVLAVDSAWVHRYEGRSRSDIAVAEKVRLEGGELREIGKHIPPREAQAEFVGLMRLSPAAVARVESALRGGVLPRHAALPEIIQLLIGTDLRMGTVDVVGDWAELNAPQDLARFVLGTKAESLERLKPRLRHGVVADLVAFTQAEWAESRQDVLRRIREDLPAGLLIVRSSARIEDGWNESRAGAFLSIPRVPAHDEARLEGAIDDVIASYGESRRDDQVLVQPMLSGVAVSGVVMTRVPGSGAPYYVVSFDDTSARTDTVTAGISTSVRTVYVLRGSPFPPELDRRLARVLSCVQEVEALVGHDCLDVEFASTTDDQVYVLQVRPIALSHAALPVDDRTVHDGLTRAGIYLGQLRRPAPHLLGKRALFGVMTDWNPAEMIGTKPSRLAFSLYRRLITDEAWAVSRADMGYRDVRPCNLIVDLLGHPYVDIRADFNSFVPAALPDSLAERLVNHYLDVLANRPELHDKVEFDVLITCLTFDFDAHAGDLAAAGFSREEISSIRSALRDVTRASIARTASDLAALDHVSRRFERLSAAAAPALERAFLLLEDARRLAFPIFSNLAREAFIAVALLRSLQRVGCTQASETESFLASVETVSGKMRRDGVAVARGELAWDAFVRAYGHLRPGTYDIASPSYASEPDLYLRPFVRADGYVFPGTGGAWSDATREAVGAQLERADLDVSGAGFEEFLRAAIAGRELGKFVASRNVSAALEALAQFGTALGFSREELGHVRIEEYFALRGSLAADPADRLGELIHRGREEFFVTQAVHLPGQIFRAEDLRCFEQLSAEPNYVTRKKITATLAVLDKPGTFSEDLGGKIVLIPSADPGYDWLFSRDIAGLVTMYGGANSHMAIRAGEFQLPAAIGVGELLFEALRSAHMLELDCAARQIKAVG